MFRLASALLCLALLCLALPAPAPAPAQEAGPAADCILPAPPTAALIEELVDWIGAETAYDIAPTRADPPAVTFCAQGEVIDYEGADLLVEPDLRAAYDLSDRRIFLVLPWDPGNPRDVSALLHELIHDVQLRNRSWDCPQQPEWEAYKLQARWLTQRGIDPGFDWLVIFLRARCPRDIHP